MVFSGLGALMVSVRISSMKNAFLAMTLTALVFVCHAAAAANAPRLIPDNIIGTEPPKSVSEWTRISVLGLRNHLYLIIWISPQSFPRSGFERLVVLSPVEYEGVGPVISAYDCLDPLTPFPEPHAVLVSEYSAAKGEGSCRLPYAASCEFLSKLAKLPGIGGVAKHEKTVRDFAEEFRCPVDAFGSAH